jgi:tRNA-splicing ligase RtcB
MDLSDFKKTGPVTYELATSHRSDMRVPLRILADETLMAQLHRDHSVEQLINVTTLPGIFGSAIGMPDMHEGYGFPVGGVAGTLAPDGVISPGGIGFDINCGVRLLATQAPHESWKAELPDILHDLARSVPTGYGRHGRLALPLEQLDKVLNEGCPYVVHALGLGRSEDLAFTESRGCLSVADAECVSERAKERGADQLGTLGGGNHFLELQRVDAVFDAAIAQSFGLFLGQLTVLLHTGSRGLGHQVCTDFVREMLDALPRHRIVLPDRQLACAPLSSPEGQRYLRAMSAAANFAWSNRQVLTHRVREVLRRLMGPSVGEVRVVYDVAHNIAKLERYGQHEVCVHRKGATRAFGPAMSSELPPAYRTTGQPVFIPGSMGTASYVLAGRDASADLSLGSTCHGAGRALSRGAAKRQVQGKQLREQLLREGIAVECASNAELAEEAPLAYKDVERVVEVVHRAGIATKVARLKPLGVLKG